MWCRFFAEGAGLQVGASSVRPARSSLVRRNLSNVLGRHAGRELETAVGLEPRHTWLCQTKSGSSTWRRGALKNVKL